METKKTIDLENPVLIDSIQREFFCSHEEAVDILSICLGFISVHDVILAEARWLNEVGVLSYRIPQRKSDFYRAFCAGCHYRNKAGTDGDDSEERPGTAYD